MQIASYVFFSLATVALAQDSTAPAAPATVPAPSNAGNTISIISPTGTKAYQPGENLTVTWTNNGDPNDWDWWGMAVQFELADASQGINKVAPIGVYLAGNSTIGDLQLITSIPATVPAGSAYCVRADVKGPRGFTYFFSPMFPIGKSLGSSNPSPAGAAPAVVTATTTGAPLKSGAVGSAVGLLSSLLLALAL
ncbi:UNVERIFIED_CONTAM: hypothetical protein HDU68_010356 [Siphonaria sp. JEL0065]|nr:hypothetical protein HDU68_010356 [Siphonaria sp. JEL0065]